MTTKKESRPESAFTTSSKDAGDAIKLPTSYQYWKAANEPQKLLQPPVDIIFLPSEKIKTYGFFTFCFRFNIRENDPRYEECAALIDLCVEKSWGLRCFYDQPEIGSTSLTFDKKKSVAWEHKGTMIRVPWEF